MFKRKVFTFAATFFFASFNLCSAGDLLVNGKVGIGTTAPTGALDVSFANGNVILSNMGGMRPTLEIKGNINSNAAVMMHMISTNSDETITSSRTLELRNYHTTTAGEKMVTSAISGDLKATGPTINDLAGQLRFLTKPSGSASAWNRMTISEHGNVGIGTTDPTERLYVLGNIHATGTITQSSSRELKQDITALTSEEAFETIKGLEPVKYTYKANNRDLQIGFIAEEVPELVATFDRKSLNPMDIVAVLTKVVQEQQRIIERQNKISYEQVKLINDISAKLEELEKRTNDILNSQR